VKQRVAWRKAKAQIGAAAPKGKIYKLILVGFQARISVQRAVMVVSFSRSPSFSS
jgi:hypothetical protein